MNNTTSEQPSNKIIPSKQLTTILLAYNLCKASIEINETTTQKPIKTKEDNQQFLTRNLIFHQGVITYYSAFKNIKESETIIDILKKPPRGLVLLRTNNEPAQNIIKTHIETQKLFTTYRNQYIAHNTKEEQNKEIEISWLEIPQGIGGSDIITNGTLYIDLHSAIKIKQKEKQNFTNLTVQAASILWQKEQQPITKYKEGKWYEIIPPKLNFDYS